MSKLDQLLGPGVVVAEDGALRLNDAALAAQRHQRSPPKGERCYCPACKADRERKPKQAKTPASQPWDPRPSSERGFGFAA